MEKIGFVQRELKETACFTGHRVFRKMAEHEIERKVSDLISDAYYKKGVSHFIYGGALGFDMLAAEQVLFLKDIVGADGILKPITLELAVPCDNQTKMWSKKQKQRYEWIKAHADVVHDKEVPYSAYAMQKRNEYMVSRSCLVIAYYENGQKGGTRNTLEYARKQNREIWYVADELE